MVKQYQRAHEASVWFQREGTGRTVMSGEDALDLLQRLSTNGLLHLEAGKTTTTGLCNRNGRLLDLLVVWHLGEQLLLIGAEGQGENTRAILHRSISWKEQVSVLDGDKGLQHITLVGPDAVEVARSFVGGLAESTCLEQNSAWFAFGPQLCAEQSVNIACPTASLPDLIKSLTAAGAVEGGQQLWQVLRVEAGLPAGGTEISGAHIPLELDLWSSVDFNKGCFVGQEVLARMESRGKLARTIVGIRSDEQFKTGVKLEGSDKIRGLVTSVASSPTFGCIGLALLRPSSVQAGTTVSVQGGGTAEVVELPFQSL